MFVFFRWRKGKYKSCNIRCAGKVKATITNTTCQHLFIKRNLAFIPLFHRHPTHRLFYPLIQTQLPKGVLFAGSLLCRITRSHHLIHSNGFIQTWVCLFPHLWVSPVLGFICSIDNRIESRIMLSAFQNVLCFLVNFIADAVGVRSGSGNQEVQRLHSGIAGTFGHNIKQLSVRLRMQFIKHNPVNVETMFAIGFSRKHLIEAVCWCVYNSFLCSKYPDSFHQSRTHTNHICGNVKNNRGLLSVCGTTIDLRSLFSVTTS